MIKVKISMGIINSFLLDRKKMR